MSIVILKTVVDNDMDTGLPISRGVTLWISDGTTNYITQRGNLPLTGDLLPGLLADEAQIWLDAVAGGQSATAVETADADLEQWLIDNPAARAIFDLTKTQAESEINALVDAIIPSATNTNRTKLKRLLMGNTLVSRLSVAGD